MCLFNLPTVYPIFMNVALNCSISNSINPNLLSSIFVFRSRHTIDIFQLPNQYKKILPGVGVGILKIFYSHHNWLPVNKIWSPNLISGLPINQCVVK